MRARHTRATQSMRATAIVPCLAAAITSWPSRVGRCPVASTDGTASTDDAEAVYALGATRAELQRLGIQHNVFAADTRALISAAGFRYGQTLCDLGCGPGTTTFELAQIVGPDGRVLAVDSSSDGLNLLQQKALEQGFAAQDDDATVETTTEGALPASTLLRHGTIGAIEVRRADVTRAFAPEASVDGLWCRWLLTWLTGEALSAALSHARTCLKPGGTAIFWDYFNACGWGVYASIPTPAYDKLHECLKEEWNRVGDPSVCAKLPMLLSAEGLELLDVRSIAPIVMHNGPSWIWPTSYFALQARRLRDAGKLSEADVEAFDKEWAALGRTPGSYYCPPTMAAFVARRPV